MLALFCCTFTKSVKWKGLAAEGDLWLKFFLLASRACLVLQLSQCGLTEQMYRSLCSIFLKCALQVLQEAISVNNCSPLGVLMPPLLPCVAPSLQSGKDFVFEGNVHTVLAYLVKKENNWTALQQQHSTAVVFLNDSRLLQEPGVYSRWQMTWRASAFIRAEQFSRPLGPETPDLCKKLFLS